MLLQNLTVDNFGVFSGCHSFDLMPYLENEQKRHLTIFSGHNGSGKSTLFQAMIFALYGSSYGGDAALNRIHRFPANLEHEEIEESGVKIDIQYVKSGKIYNLQVKRRWKKEKRGIREILTVLNDDQPPEIDPSDYQTWINDFIAPGVGQLCFFDAEHLDALSNRDKQSTVLRETLVRLLGLDLVQHLDSDLELLMKRQGSTKNVEHIYTKVLELQVARNKLDEQITQLREEYEITESDISNCKSALTQQERLLAAEGGGYAAKQPTLQNRLHIVQKEVELLSSQLRDLCGELLPFAFVPELGLQLQNRLIAEVKVRRQQTINILLQEKLPEIETILSDDTVWAELNISSEGRTLIIRQLTEKLRDFGISQTTNETPAIHHLSEPEHEQLQSWIAYVIREIPQRVQQLGSQLRTVREEQRRIEADLRRVPDEAGLAPIQAEISRLEKILSNRQKHQNALNVQIGVLQFQRDEKQRTLQDAVAQYEKLQKFERELKYAERSKAIMRTYKDVLTRQKLQALEEILVVSFNRICRKEHLLSKVRIEPDSFDIHLENVAGISLNLSEFSAGERQLYAMALLWALRQVSKLPLPLVIDTPLARLDEAHRLRLMHDYIPLVSDQVLLFTTDAELDANLLREVEPYVARIYRLQHYSSRGETTVSCEHQILRKKVNTYGV